MIKYIPLLILFLIFLSCSQKKPGVSGINTDSLKIIEIEIKSKSDSISTANKNANEIRFIIPTFRGNSQRNYYGDSLPSELNVKWKYLLGSGMTSDRKHEPWYGAGRTGQPLLVKEKGKLF